MEVRPGTRIWGVSRNREKHKYAVRTRTRTLTHHTITPFHPITHKHKRIDGSFLSSASPHHTNTNGNSSRGRSARAIARSARSKNSNNIAAVSQSYQSNPFRSASVKKDMSNTLRRSQLPSKPAFSSFNRGSAKKRPNLTTLNGYSSSPNLISPENDENAAPNTTHIPSPSSSNSPGKLALNPLEVPKKNSQQKGKRPNPNARMPKQSQSTYKQQLLGMGNKSTQSASKVVLSSGGERIVSERTR